MTAAEAIVVAPDGSVAIDSDPCAIVHRSLDRIIADSYARSRVAHYRVLRTPLVPCGVVDCFICRNPRRA